MLPLDLNVIRFSSFHKASDLFILLFTILFKSLHVLLVLRQQLLSLILTRLEQFLAVLCLLLNALMLDYQCLVSLLQLIVLGTICIRLLNLLVRLLFKTK